MDIAITGTIGSGKSGVAAIMTSQLAAQWCDSDALCHQLLEPHQPGWQQLVELWGKRFLQADGTLDRDLLRAEVFTDPALRHSLEKILHPLVRQELQACSRQAAARQCPLIVEVPLLHEAAWQDDFDLVCAVYAPPALCISRVVARSGLLPSQAEAILKSQLSAEEKAERSDYVVDNAGLWASTVLQCQVLARRVVQRPL